MKAQIAAQCILRDCDYCGRSGPTVSVEWLADQVRYAINSHYDYTSPDPDDVPLEALKDGDWERGGEPLIQLIAGMLCAEEEAIAAKVHGILESRYGDVGRVEIGEEDPWSQEAHYARSSPSGLEYKEAWADLERTLSRESRYFNKRAEEVLELVFDGIESLTSPFGFTAIQTGGPGRVFNTVYRGRVARSEGQLKKILADPERELGAPPKGMARAGRMNAHGFTVQIRMRPFLRKFVRPWVVES